MVYGKLSGLEVSGLMDRGCQYGVIQDHRITIEGLVTHDMYYDSSLDRSRRKKNEEDNVF